MDHPQNDGLVEFCNQIVEAVLWKSVTENGTTQIHEYPFCFT